LQPGHLYVAPPDHHLLVVDDHLLLSRGPTENGHRPAVNALFRSAAQALGPRVIGIVLSGVLDDGAAGMVTIASQGGMTLVQDPEEALYPGMPRSVLRLLQPDFVLLAAQMGKVVAEQVGEPVKPRHGSTLTTLENLEAALAERGDVGIEHEIGELGKLAGLSCPDCQGALVELVRQPDFVILGVAA
jgi:two-component system chemotaxis response regulator CheB